MNIYLIGYMGSGKSTAGHLLSERMQMPFYDLDDVFESKYKISIPDFFQKYGEEQFRKLEHALLEGMSKLKQSVIATGGGTPCFFESMQLMNTTGLTVYLETSPEILLGRIKGTSRRRPLFDVMNQQTALQELSLHLKSREKFYELADIKIDARDPDFEEIAMAFAKKQSALQQ